MSCTAEPRTVGPEVDTYRIVEAITVRVKFCNRCRTLKPTVEYSPDKRNRDGLQGRCKTCIAIGVREVRRRNPTRTAAKKRAYLQRHPQRAAALAAAFRARPDQKAKTAERNRRWLEKNAPKNREKVRAYEARKLHATPGWANQEAIDEIYREADRLTRETGVPHQVDHIVPLNHPLVCGLHVETNLRVIPAAENMAKRNRWWPGILDCQRVV